MKWIDLKEKYCKEKEKINEDVNVWDGVSKLPSASAEIKLLITPELIEKYISKWELSSDSAEIKLLTTPELVEKYISKWELSSDSAEIKLLITPELIEKYISKWGLDDNIKKIINKNLNEEKKDGE